MGQPHKTPTTKTTRKKTYQSPRLKTYGSVAQNTDAGGASSPYDAMGEKSMMG